MIDSHCHLAGEEFESDLPAVIARAQEGGVAAALVILSAGDIAEIGRAGRVKQLWPAVHFSVGIHPHRAGEYAADVDAGIAQVEAAIDSQGAVAVGEIGLDYHYDFSPRPVQQEVFRRQLRLARERELPVVIHTREAEDDTFEILRDEGPGVRVVFHCFTGGKAMAARALEIGAWLSFAGIVTFPKAVDLHDVARTVAADRFLVETDSPYLAPVPFRGKRNEPAFVGKVVEAVAGLRGDTADRVAEQTSSNFETVFGLGKRPTH
jgi:TatD DNase family protein